MWDFGMTDYEKGVLPRRIRSNRITIFVAVYIFGLWPDENDTADGVFRLRRIKYFQHYLLRVRLREHPTS